jgi:hypothetical protein
VQQDKFVDKVIKGNSALPNSIATVADRNADVRGEAQDYRDPAAAVQQDTAAGECRHFVPWRVLWCSICIGQPRLVVQYRQCINFLVPSNSSVDT